MPTATLADTLTVSDATGRDLGRVAVESIEDGLVLGDFTPGPDYPAVAEVFGRFSDMVEYFSLSLIDEATADITSLGVVVRTAPDRPPVSVWDVQIYRDGGFSCRLPPVAERNGARAH